ncbi:MAG: CDP-2,3-bis-(O-geranylgeranyl)-sn-glycerol synthase [Thermoprotei archaeon]|nr:MAG: CDP-2,3-bis-(O-geranylgeranyl)-sn-glycerol synthase [Thermoprotei archaeon]
MLDLVISAILKYLPAMLANGTPVFVKNGTPIDGGKYFIDRRRILGDGKTWEGLVIGLTFASIVGVAYYTFCGQVVLLIYSIVLGLGALLGDIIAAFIKRRVGIPRGKPAPILDQINFILGSTFLVKLLGIDSAAGISITLSEFLLILIIASLLHILANFAAFKLGIKPVPW